MAPFGVMMCLGTHYVCAKFWPDWASNMATRGRCSKRVATSRLTVTARSGPKISRTLYSKSESLFSNIYLGHRGQNQKTVDLCHLESLAKSSHLTLCHLSSLVAPMMLTVNILTFKPTHEPMVPGPFHFQKLPPLESTFAEEDKRKYLTNLEVLFHK